MSPTRTARPAVLGVAVGALVAGGLVTTASPAAAAPTDARITEVHYGNGGTDTGEAIEVTAPAAADLTGLSRGPLQRQQQQSPTRLAVPASSTGIAVVPGPANGIQNGSPDGSRW